jgi:arylsulfatase A-like enzyme
VKLTWDYPQLLPDRFSPATEADVYVDLFLDWNKRVDGPWAACINFMDAHLPYQPAPGHDRWSDETLERLQESMDDQVWEFVGGRRPWWQREALEALYDGTIHQMDAQLRRLVETLSDRGELEETLLIVTSDHGECFGEYSHVQPARLAGHGPGIAEELIHVPLVVRKPGQKRARRVSEPVSLTHFPDAVAAILNGNDPTQPFVDGDTLVSYQGLPESAKIRARKYASEEALDALDGRSRAAYVDQGPGVRKYVAWHDRSRAVQVIDPRTSYAVDENRENPTPNQELDEAFERISDAGVKQRGDDDIDDATRRRLEDLGYG